MRARVRQFAFAALVIMMAAGLKVFSQSTGQLVPATAVVDAVLAAHHAWKTPPASVEISGTSTRGSVTEPIKVTATRLNEVIVESGVKRLVATADSFFKEDGDKLSRQPTPSGFTQLDVTGVFLLAQLARRPITTGPPQLTKLQGANVRRFHVDNHRTEIHYGRIRVSDEFDLYVDDNGLLAGISRAFYQNDKPFDFTLACTFSDYRDTSGVLLPYRIEKFLSGQKIETIAVSNYAIDVPTTSAQFRPRRMQ